MSTTPEGIQGISRRLRASAAGIGGRLIATMLLAATLITVAIAGAEVWANYQNDLRDLDAEVEHIRRASLDPIALSLWNYDDAQLGLQLEGIRQRPFVASADVLEPGADGVDAALRGASGGKYPGGLRIVHLPLSYQRDGEKAELGVLAIGLDVGAVRQTALRRAVSILATQAGITLLISFVLLLVVRQIITRHLSALAHAAQRFDLRDERANFRIRPRAAARATRSTT